MTSLPVKAVVATVGLAFLLATPADAQTRKNRSQAAASASRSAVPIASAKGPNVVMFGNEYLGADPDPRIRHELLRDLCAHFGGNF